MHPLRADNRSAAHARGIAVIVGVIYNHFGPSDLDLWQFDGWRLMLEINVEIQQRFPGKISIAEGVHRNDLVTRDVAAGGCGFSA